MREMEATFLEGLEQHPLPREKMRYPRLPRALIQSAQKVSSAGARPRACARYTASRLPGKSGSTPSGVVPQLAT